jgi:AraC family transcriptional regulator of adaptative response/methylated-DNA-[protein]-cysteine methyltransferase
MIYNLDDLRWQKIVDRLPGDFIYAVETMGIYCVPGCAAPRPLRHNVRLFETPEEAEAAGFRACRRCDPRGERAALARAIVADACAFIEREPVIPPLAQLAARSGYSRFHFLRLFRNHTGLTPRLYAEGIRARRLQNALINGTRVADAVQDAGYGSESRVYENTGKLMGMTPGKLRRGGAGETIRTASADSPFGRILVGATQAGVCYLGFAEPREALISDLRRRFPRAVVVEDDAGLAATLTAILAYLEEPSAGLALPLDLRGTAFQQRVWAALCQIPAGETRSYAEIAAMIEAPRAARAVARSCATNPVALAVPCHRVVGSDGTLTGYRWGLPQKQKLLAGEKG